MSINHGPNDWRGEHLIRVPRAPKPEQPSEPRGFVADHIKEKAYDMARRGEFVPTIAQHTGLHVSKVRDLLLKAGIDFNRAKLSTTGKRVR